MRRAISQAFSHQKSNAKLRGIEFDFEKAEWCLWWEDNLGPDWFQKRGCRKGQYVMARYYDDGPYAAHNVKCVLSEDNHIERNRRIWKSRFKNRKNDLDWYKLPIR